MFERLIEHGARVGRQAEDLVIDGLIEAASSELLSGVVASRVDGGIMLSGNNLRRRWVNEPALRGFARGVSR